MPLGVRELALDAESCGLGLELAFLGMEARRDLALDRAHAREPFEEIAVPRGPPVLAVGDRFEPDLLLQPHRLADRLVLDAGKLGRGELVAVARLARPAQLLRAQQGADMIGAERRLGTLRQGWSRWFVQFGGWARARAARMSANAPTPPAAPSYCVGGCISCQGSFTCS